MLFRSSDASGDILTAIPIVRPAAKARDVDLVDQGEHFQVGEI